MDASPLSDRSIAGTAMTAVASGIDPKKHRLPALNGDAIMLKSRPGLLAAGAAAWCIIAASAAAAAPAVPGGPAASAQVSENFARAQITRDGYTKLTDLQQTDKGWTAKALEDGKQVSLIVSSIGGVQKQ